MKPRFTFALVRKLAARALFAAFLLALPRALVAQTAEDLCKKGLHEKTSGAPDAAMADFNQAIALDPNYAPAYHQLGLMKAAKKDYDGAIADYDRAIQLNPNYARAYSARGNAKVQKRDFNGAMADCDRAIALDPSFVPAYVNRGNAKAAKNDFDGAIADFNQAIALNPQKAGLAYRGRALAMTAKQNDADVDTSKLSPLKPSEIDPEPDVPAHAIYTELLSLKPQDDITHTMQLWGMRGAVEQIQAQEDITHGWGQGGGVAQIGFVVDTEGRVRNPFVISSTDSDLDQPAMDAALKSRYRPALHHGAPVNSYAEVALGYYANNNKYTRWGDVTEVGGADIDIPDSKIHPGKLPPELQYDTPSMPVNTVFPVYPFELLRDDRKGNAQVGFFVSPTGKVEQAVLLKATRPEFGWALLAMVEQLKFQPAIKDGKPLWAVLTMKRKFSRSSDDVQVSDETLDLLNKLQKEKPPFCPIQDLDIQLKPLSSPPPIFPSKLAGIEAGGRAVVEVLIDKEGTVQLPRVVSATDRAFGYAAVQCVSMWKFAPPTSHGQPVVVQTSIPITFGSFSPLPAPSPPVNLDGAQLLNLSDLDQAPVARWQMPPEYPYDMKSHGITGTVVVGFIIDFGGNVQDAHVITSSGHSEMDQAAVDAISKWQYAPGMKNGHAVNTRLQIPISYNIIKAN